MSGITVRYRRSFDSDGDTIVHCIASHPKLKKSITVKMTVAAPASERAIRNAERSGGREAKAAARKELEG